MKKYILSVLSVIYMVVIMPTPVVKAANMQQSDPVTCTIHVSAKSIKEVFAIIEKQTGLTFIHSASEAQLGKKISISEDNQPLDDVLAKISKQSGLVFKRVDKTIYVK